MSALPFFFFFNDPATTEISTLSLHDALPISPSVPTRCGRAVRWPSTWDAGTSRGPPLRSGRPACPRPIDRKSTRLNSSHLVISYAVFCLKKKNADRHMKTLMPECLDHHIDEC